MWGGASPQNKQCYGGMHGSLTVEIGRTCGNGRVGPKFKNFCGHPLGIDPNPLTRSPHGPQLKSGSPLEEAKGSSGVRPPEKVLLHVEALQGILCHVENPGKAARRQPGEPNPTNIKCPQ